MKPSYFDERKGRLLRSRWCQEFVKDNWWHREASIALGRLFSEMGDVAGAEDAWRRASWLDVHDAEALNLMALLSVRQNKLEDACRTQRRAVARQPDQPRQYLLLSDILSKMGRVEEARETLAEVGRMESMARPRVAVNLIIPPQLAPRDVDFARCAGTIGALHPASYARAHLYRSRRRPEILARENLRGDWLRRTGSRAGIEPKRQRHAGPRRTSSAE